MDYYGWMLTWNMILAVSTTVMAIAIVATAIFAIVQLWNIKKARCSALLMQLHQTWDSAEYIKARSLMNKHYKGSTPEEASEKLKEAMISFDEANAEEYFIIVRIANFFENLGFLACQGYLDRKDALELFGDTAENYWNLFSASAKYEKYESSDPQPEAWLYFEKLALGFPKEEGLAKNTSP